MLIIHSGSVALVYLMMEMKYHSLCINANDFNFCLCNKLLLAAIPQLRKHSLSGLVSLFYVLLCTKDILSIFYRSDCFSCGSSAG